MVTTTIYNHNGLSSSNKESDELNHEILENQIVEQSASTPENIDKVSMIENSGSKEDPNHMQIQAPTVTVQSFSNMVQNALKEVFHTEKKLSAFEW